MRGSEVHEVYKFTEVRGFTEAGASKSGKVDDLSYVGKFGEFW